jgi:lysozyme
LNIAQAAVKRLVKVPISQNQFDAITSLVYNIGQTAFAHSTLLKLLNNMDYDGTAKQFLAWNKVQINGIYKASDGLSKRRKEESELFSLFMEK